MTDHQHPYGFPFPPYPAQVDFMDRASGILQAGGLGILELPTGGGKSLALLSACLQWLRQQRVTLLAKKLGNGSLGDDALPAWVKSQLEKQMHEAVAETTQAWERQQVERLERIRLSEFHKGEPSRPSKKRNVETSEVIESDKLAAKIDKIPDKIQKYPQIIIASRTHSQLAQLVKEFKRSSWSELFSGVTLGSRQNLCVLHETRDLTAEQITDLCRESVDSGICEFRKNSSNLADRLLESKPMDIEEIREFSLKSAVRGCGYFGTREAVKEADVIFVPYSSLLNANTRESLEIDLAGNVLVIDEAHNIIEATNSSNTMSVAGVQLDSLRAHLKLYIAEYSSKLNPQNLVLLKQCDIFVRKFASLSSNAELLSQLRSVSEVVELLSGPETVTKWLFFLRDSDLPRKLRGFALRKKQTSPSAVYTFQSLLTGIAESRSIFDRILVEETKISFVSIDADSRLARVISKTHATLLVGGTMRPIAELAVVARESGKPTEVFQGKHVIPADRIFCRILAREDLCFTYGNAQADWSVVSQAVGTLANSLDRGGVAVFVPSYDMLGKFKAALETKPVSTPVIFDSKSEDVDALLRTFKTRIQHGVCILVSVVGGRLSEGIDFKDDLCRGLVLVGLPYPNIKDAVLAEKMRYYDAKKTKDPKSCISGHEFYEAKCIKAINQTVGRAIRHKDDWAGIFLVDSRFARPTIHDNLSQWLRDAGIRTSADIPGIARDFHAFVRRMRRL